MAPSAVLLLASLAFAQSKDNPSAPPKDWDQAKKWAEIESEDTRNFLRELHVGLTPEQWDEWVAERKQEHAIEYRYAEKYGDMRRLQVEKMAEELLKADSIEALNEIPSAFAQIELRPHSFDVWLSEEKKRAVVLKEAYSRELAAAFAYQVPVSTPLVQASGFFLRESDAKIVQDIFDYQQKLAKDPELFKKQMEEAKKRADESSKFTISLNDRFGGRDGGRNFGLFLDQDRGRGRGFEDVFRTGDKSVFVIDAPKIPDTGIRRRIGTSSFARVHDPWAEGQHRGFDIDSAAEGLIDRYGNDNDYILGKIIKARGGDKQAEKWGDRLGAWDEINDGIGGGLRNPRLNPSGVDDRLRDLDHYFQNRKILDDVAKYEEDDGLLEKAWKVTKRNTVGWVATVPVTWGYTAWKNFDQGYGTNTASVMGWDFNSPSASKASFTEIFEGLKGANSGFFDFRVSKRK